MTVTFDDRDLRQLRDRLVGRGYRLEDKETVRKDSEATFGLVHLANRDETIMPRLSVGLRPLSETGVVLSTDLHVLVSPQKFYSYSQTHDDLAQLERELVDVGLPWLERHLELGQLTLVLEQKRALRSPPAAQRRWWSRRIEREKQEPGISPLVLRALSHCYELQGRNDEALRAWQQYLATKTPATGGELVERLRALEAKSRG